MPEGSEDDTVVIAKHAKKKEEKHAEHHPAPVPEDPDMPKVSDLTVAFFAAGALVVFVVALLVYLA